eukprot:TRINITY_DN4176_c0_g1_i1.p1 TRINITY_DN4176_c0_g1~~TRINITY_DN4176_c0_g1_i1.p1  ORF type:complete len:1337 (-),score=484.54 TRINITY_DN4176_c0_g1_i1:40-3669(-)
MENISMYLRTCPKLGLSSSLFNTLDLYEEKDLFMVFANLEKLKQIALKYDNKIPDAQSGETAANRPSPTRPFSRDSPSKPRDPSPAAQKDRSPSPARVSASLPCSTPASVVAATNTPAAAAPATKAPLAVPSVSSLEQDVHVKEEFKYSTELESHVKTWILAVLEGHHDPALFESQSFADALKSGVVLCKLLNVLKPGTIPRINTSNLAYAKMENISAYLRAVVRVIGLPTSDCFNTVDLFEEKNMNQVVNNLYSLARFANKSGLTTHAVHDASHVRTLFSESIIEKTLEEVDNTEQLPTTNPAHLELLNWMNGQLTSVNVTAKNLSTDLRPGVKLLKLLQVLCKEPLGVYDEQPKVLWQYMQNASFFINRLSQHTFDNISCCNAQDIVMGNADNIFKLLVFLRDKFDLDFLFLKLLNEGQDKQISLDDAELLGDAISADKLDEQEQEQQLHEKQKQEERLRQQEERAKEMHEQLEARKTKEKEEKERREREEQERKKEERERKETEEREKKEREERKKKEREEIEKKERDERDRKAREERERKEKEEKERKEREERERKEREERERREQERKERVEHEKKEREERERQLREEQEKEEQRQREEQEKERRREERRRQREQERREQEERERQEREKLEKEERERLEREAEQLRLQREEEEREKEQRREERRRRREQRAREREEQLRRELEDEQRRQEQERKQREEQEQKEREERERKDREEKERQRREAEEQEKERREKEFKLREEKERKEREENEQKQREERERKEREARENKELEEKEQKEREEKERKNREDRLAQEQKKKEMEQSSGRTRSGAVTNSAAADCARLLAAQNAVRMRVAQELLETEESYLKCLMGVTEYLISAAVQGDILTRTECDSVFANWQAITVLHKTLYAELSSRISKWSAATTVGDIISHRMKDFETYGPFLANYSVALVSLHYLLQSNHKFKTLVSHFECMQMAESRLDMESFLVMPVQRLPRYLLLMQSMLKYTNKGHPDHALLTGAARDMDVTIATLNKSIDPMGGVRMRKLMSIAQSIADADGKLQNLVTASRTLTREGLLDIKLERSSSCPAAGRPPKHKNTSYCFLFNDLLLYCDQSKKAKEGKPFVLLDCLSLPQINNIVCTETEIHLYPRLQLQYTGTGANRQLTVARSSASMVGSPAHPLLSASQVLSLDQPSAVFFDWVLLPRNVNDKQSWEQEIKRLVGVFCK